MIEKNNYGNVTPPRGELKSISDELIHRFKKHFLNRGYVEHPSVLISSGMDKSTRFIGSHISVLKPYFLEKRIPARGFVMAQDCVRTKNLKKMYDNSSLIWGSYFTNLGLLVDPKQIKKICFDTLDFLLCELKIGKELIRVRVCSQDQDLKQICSEYFVGGNLEEDTKPREYYRHKYGIDGVFGRNFNIALKDSNGDAFSDIGNIIVIESGRGSLGVELGLGNSTTLKQLYGLEHVLDLYNIEYTPRGGGDRRKFEDSIVVCTALFREGLRPSSSNQGQSLRQYADALNHFRLKEGLSLDELSKILFNFESHQFRSAETYRHIIDFLERSKKGSIQSS